MLIIMTITQPCHTMRRKQAQSEKVRLFQGSHLGLLRISVFVTVGVTLAK